MTVQRLPAWLLLFYQHGRTHHVVYQTEEEFEGELHRLMRTGATQICCLTPRSRYPCFTVHMVEEESETV